MTDKIYLTYDAIRQCTVAKFDGQAVRLDDEHPSARLIEILAEAKKECMGFYSIPYTHENWDTIKANVQDS
jgi:hypothetical protein